MKKRDYLSEKRITTVSLNSSTSSSWTLKKISGNNAPPPLRYMFKIWNIADDEYGRRVPIRDTFTYTCEGRDTFHQCLIFKVEVHSGPQPVTFP